MGWLPVFSSRPATPERRWPARWLLFASAALALTCIGLTANAQPQPPPKAPSGEASTNAQTANKALAGRHFQNGVRLFQDENYAGALAEFEAAYALKPSAASLQNIALALKALFRYAESADTLQRLLTKHASELGDDEKQAVREAIDELESLVGSVIVRVEPADAKVSVDGRSVPPEKYKNGLRLNVGEHTIVAEAPGYDPATRVVRIAGGRSAVPVEIRLIPRTGFVSVVTGDPEAAIAVDGEAVAFDRWRGPVTPGRHYVQVYKRGYEPFEQVVSVRVGTTQTIKAPALSPLDEEDGDAEIADPRQGKVGARQLRGFYALGVVNIGGQLEAPRPPPGSSVAELSHADTGPAPMSTIGVRAGYRIWTPVGVEGLLEGGRAVISNVCVRGAVNEGLECGDEAAETQQYTLELIRVGGNLRIMSGGEKLRFTSATGVGAVRHQLEMGPGPLDTYKASGFDPYFTLEVGAQYNWGHILLEADVFGYFEGISSVKSGNWQPYADANGLQLIGLSLRMGWSEWRPR